MFKKLKDKLAEEVKSSPQRIQLFAQAAQAAVTSASSSISDITNSDLFSIGDNDVQQPQQSRLQVSPATQHKMLQDVSLMQSVTESTELSQEIVDGQRQRRLSNSSFASDVSFRLPNYETPSMYHLQSDMEVSASEADERGFSGGPATLDRVTKEQLYAAYKRTQERYKKYRTQYGDLARHYKLLERENAKARSVLVETQDKALRRISELKEQCTLEQSAKAHLEKALRVEMEEKNMKIEALSTKIQLIQNDMPAEHDNKTDISGKAIAEPEIGVQLINLENENNTKLLNDDFGSETISLNSKIEKMEQLLFKYKESLKTSKEKYSQITTELQILTKELETKNKQIQNLQNSEEQLNEAKKKIQELNHLNEELQNQINTFDFTKTKELSTLELDLQKANEEIADLRGKIEIFSKQEEEYAISLAENKLSIHKELESKEAEIKSLKKNLSDSQKEIQSLKIVVDDYKNSVSVLEEEKVKLNNDCTELALLKNKIVEMDTKLQELSKNCQSLELLKTKADEEYKCLQLQLKQETAEKLAMIDRNLYLESKNTQLSEENTKKSTKINNLESELQTLFNSKTVENNLLLKETENIQLHDEISMWKEKCGKLELEIQEEREELVKLQAEIEKLLSNHELLQAQNFEFRTMIANLTSECSQHQENILNYKSLISTNIQKTFNEVKELKENIYVTAKEYKANLETNKNTLLSSTENITIFLNTAFYNILKDIEGVTARYNELKLNYDTLQTKITTDQSKESEVFNELNMIQKENNTLKIKLNESDSENDRINKKLENISNEYKSTLEKVKTLSNENKELAKKLQEIEESNQQVQTMLNNEKAQHLITTDQLKTFDTDKQNLSVTVQTLESRNKELDTKIEQLNQQHRNTCDEMKTNYDSILKIKEEEIEKIFLYVNQQSHLLEQIKQLKVENDISNDLITNLENQNKKIVSENEDLSKENKAAIAKINELRNEIDNKAKALEKSQQDQVALEKELAQYAISSEMVTELECIKQNLTEKLTSLEDKNKQLNIELQELKSQQEAAKRHVQGDGKILTSKCNECDIKHIQINDLGEKISVLTQENISLKTEAANFAFNIKKLESEIDDIKLSHTEIETEKDRLNTIIEELEYKQKEATLISNKNDKDTQTEANSDDNHPKEEASAVLENKWVMEHKQTLSSTASMNLKKENLEDIYEQYSYLKINHDSLKDDNRRLQSDIEGLQSYLTKISKENSVLNDKLRELIATSENTTDNDQLSTDVKELRKEIHISKEKINDLLRENSLLIEENLELKDQLQWQNYSKPVETKTASNNDKDLDNMFKVKYNEMLEMNSHLKKQNLDLEQINNSVSVNMQQIQEKNEKLKLSNEKLERRLDEALVSLRHLHALQENTELEYLRNILYEYLTGSGIHSVTLAKVLAAIVKFDDVQTQMVLQKEKERQGFLRQLGII